MARPIQIFLPTDKPKIGKRPKWRRRWRKRGEAKRANRVCRLLAIKCSLLNVCRKSRAKCANFIRRRRRRQRQRQPPRHSHRRRSLLRPVYCRFSRTVAPPPKGAQKGGRHSAETVLPAASCFLFLTHMHMHSHTATRSGENAHGGTMGAPYSGRYKFKRNI